MDAIQGFFDGLGWLAGVVVVAVIVFVGFIFVRTRYKIADANQALVITGGKREPRILVGGSAFVSPFRKADYFDLGIMTVTSKNEETHTSTLIPVVVEWTAQLRPDASRDEKGELNQSLRNAILGFTNYDGQIKDSLQQSLEGEVRSAVATLTPEELVRNKASFATEVDTKVRDSMAELGYKLVSLNIGKISDPNGHYDNLAAGDREEKRREAANLMADADQGIAIKSAEADQASKAAQQKRDLAVAEQERDLALRQAQIQTETDTAKADAQIAGQLQTELRNQELAAREGEVAVVREQQRQAAALARREVEVTEAETAKSKTEIEASAAARRSEIDAQAQAAVAKAKAQGEADAEVLKAQGQADAIKRTTEAEAEKTRQTGLAAAEVARAQGEAEADAIRAKGSAEAEAQRLMAEALAANEGANLRVTLAEIDSKMRISVSTEMGKAMAEVGKNAKFVDMGGGSGQGGNLLTRVMGDIPTLFNQLDVQSDALQDTTFGATVASMVGALKGKAPEVPSSAPTPQTVVVEATESKVDEAAEPTTDPAPAEEVPEVDIPVVPEVSIVVEQPAATEAVVAQEPPASEPVALVEESTSVQKLDLPLNEEAIEAALVEFAEGGTSLSDIATHFGLTPEKLEEFVDRKITITDLISGGAKLAKGSRTRKRTGR